MGIENLYKYLPERIYLLMIKLSPVLASQIDEIRLRAGRPMSLTTQKGNLFIDPQSRLCGPADAVSATESELRECVARLTRSSVYAYEECIRRGFIPLPDGSRAGVCGETVCVGGAIKSVKVIDSVSLRVSRFIPDAARGVCAALRRELLGTLVYSPPGGGKTTFLRSAAYLLSTGREALRVGVADERDELITPEMSACTIDRISGCPKALAVEILTRTMSPQVIICDEIGVSGAEELLAAANSGVCIIASCHGADINEIMSRPQIAALIKSGVFRRAVRLRRGERAGSELHTL
ncbi:MAG: hypothetical protein IJK33_04145 [Clostridia bacterium]|nr:hypothetical protein [Clostridia bacterium]